MRTATDAWSGVAQLASDLVGAWGCWAPTLTPDGRQVAFVSDRRGTPELWVQSVADGAVARYLPLSSDPVLAVHWSPDGQWLACSIATAGGVRTEVWVVRPDGTRATRVAGGSEHAILGPWARGGHGLVVTICSDEPQTPNDCRLIDPESGDSESVARGDLVNVLDLTADTRFALLRDGTRGAQFCRLVDRSSDLDFAVLPYPEMGSTDVGLLRPARAANDDAIMVAYLVTDAGQPRRELIAIGIHEDGRRLAAGTLAAREDAELEYADADEAGAHLVLVWNAAGRSEVELLDTASGRREACPGLPGEVVSGIAMARDGSCAVLSVESPIAPRALWRLDVATRQWQAVTAPSVAAPDLVRPQFVRFDAHDGLPLTGWLYPAREATGAAMLSLHGGPEAQERPTFNPQHQVLAALGITVLAPNIRGSSGFGRSFVHADDRYGRFDAIRDVADCARILVERGWADPDRIAVTGRSYGGYATLLALVRHAPSFAAGVDICGMSDLLTFYRDTEPWIGAAAVTKYGDPVHDAALLAELSPLHQVEAIEVPLLVVHGELDTNVPLGEATQLVARLRALGRPVQYLELPGEGHEYRRADSRLALLRELASFLTRSLEVV
jgi:dipeptidyl aminopeptidase/acylaminoacyl peptidase